MIAKLIGYVLILLIGHFFPGHNGLVCGAYLARAGKKVAILERRDVVGGAAVTEEIVPGFKFSRASYVLGLLRPHIYKELELKVRCQCINSND